MEPSRVEPDEAAADYRRVERAIAHLIAHRSEQPGLAELAGVVGLSEGHFQRLFQRWAGVSAKSFLRYLTLGEAKRLLAESSVLASSLELGLSGPSRLHDLFVGYEAMTPGEYRTQAAGVDVRWSAHRTPFGEAVFAATERGLCGLVFVEASTNDLPQELRAQWPGARWIRDGDATRIYADELDARVRGGARKPLSLLLQGTRFQLRVWEALLRIPPGAAVSYGTLAAAVGAPAAARAVGTAVGANPIAYLIPCHRVIRATGALGGYRWGEPRKRVILAVEQAWGPRGPSGDLYGPPATPESL
jgi:AraC family transcriptional regulator, regulatory protein of adaptative response / methylated-DNA-[protein]-cysteine methyltransferase